MTPFYQDTLVASLVMASASRDSSGHTSESGPTVVCLAYRFSIRTDWRPPELVGGTRRHQPAGAVSGCAARRGPKLLGAERTRFVSASDGRSGGVCVVCEKATAGSVSVFDRDVVELDIHSPLAS